MVVVSPEIRPHTDSPRKNSRLVDDKKIAPLFFHLYSNPLAVALVERFLQAGKAVQDAQDEDKKKRASEAFEDLVDRELEGSFAKILLDNHPVYQGNLLTVVRYTIGPSVRGQEELPMRHYRGVSDRSGKKG